MPTLPHPPLQLLTSFVAEEMHAYSCQRAWRTSAAVQCKKCLDMKGQNSKKTLGQAQPKNKTQGVAWGEVLKYRNNWSRGYVPFLCSSSVKSKHLCAIFGTDLSVAQATVSGFPFWGCKEMLCRPGC